MLLNFIYLINFVIYVNPRKRQRSNTTTNICWSTIPSHHNIAQHHIDNESTTVASCSDTPRSKHLHWDNAPILIFIETEPIPSSQLTLTVHTAKDPGQQIRLVQKVPSGGPPSASQSSGPDLWASRIPHLPAGLEVFLQLFTTCSFLDFQGGFMYQMCACSNLIRISKQQANSAHIINWAILKSVRCLLFQSQSPTQSWGVIFKMNQQLPTSCIQK